MKITGPAPPNFLPNVPKVCRGGPFLLSVFPHPSLGQNEQVQGVQVPLLGPGQTAASPGESQPAAFLACSF